MANLVRSGARRLPGSALLHRPSPGVLLHRPSPGGLLCRTQVAGISSERKLAEELIFLKSREIAMLESLEFKLPSSPPSDIPSPKKLDPVSTDTVKNVAVLVGGVAFISGIGWLVMSGTEGGQKVKGESLKVKGEYLKEKRKYLKEKGMVHPQKHKDEKKSEVPQVEDNGCPKTT